MTSTLAPPARLRREWVVVCLITLGSLALLVTWLLGTSTGALREQLRTLQFWWLEASLLSAVLLAIYLLASSAGGFV